MFSFFLIIFVLCVIASTFLYRPNAPLLKKRPSPKNPPTPRLSRPSQNPILCPIRGHAWESEAVFNPAAICENGRVHLLYRAMGPDGISRIGYASSVDGIHFDERHLLPIFSPEDIPAIAPPTPKKFRNPFTSPARTYDRECNPSGGGWGGSEDPRMVRIDDRLHITFNLFNGWYDMRIGLLSIDPEDFCARRWDWKFNHLSAPGRHKNWVLFPEKIGGKYVIFHNLYHEDPTRVSIEYADDIEVSEHLPPFYSPDPQRLPSRIVAWHDRTRSAGPPPLKTDRGWLLFYQAMEVGDSNRYKVGALLLDLEDPSKILYRSVAPVLAPDMPYENDWKPGIIYTTGAVIKDDTLFLYYGGGDKTVNVAIAPLNDFLEELTHNGHAVLTAPAV